MQSGCFPSDQYSVIQIENRTDAPVDIFLLRNGDPVGSQILSGVAPGTSYPFSNIAEGCTEVQFVAKDAAGTVISRSPTPVCRPSPG